jgi:NAD(P)-dependent dehydrogenase (short-subunit alcohol dehydrogenase family)
MSQQKVPLLEGYKALVAGATGEVGKGAAVALWRAGAEVWIVGRNESKLQEIKSSLMEGDDDKVHVLAADYSTSRGARDLEAMLPPGDFDVVVAFSGPWWNVSKLHDTDVETLEAALSANVLAHMLLYRILVKRTTRHYVMVTGVAGGMLPHTSLTGITDNAVAGLAKVAAAECGGGGGIDDIAAESGPKPAPFTSAVIACSVGHRQFRGAETNDPMDFGRAFVAMALGKHLAPDANASSVTVKLTDDTYRDLVSQV